jgi:signal transduction histidine kinase
VVVASAFLTYARNEASSERVEHTHEVLDGLAQIDVLVERAETASRGYLLAPDQRRAQSYKQSVSAISPAVETVRQRTADNPVQKHNLDELEKVVTSEVAALNRIMGTATAGRLDEARKDFRSNIQYEKIAEIRATASRIAVEEEKLLAERRATEQRSGTLLKLVLGLAALLMLIAGAFIFYVASRYITDLATARDRLFTLNTDLEGEVKRRTADLQRANDEVQRFAYIVSHDLRSPLVNILGFTAELEATNKTLGKLIAKAQKEAPKLVTDDVRNAQADLPEAIGFIRASTQKMDRLINAILRLSREGRRSLTPELLPMDHVLGEVAASLIQPIEEAGATLNIATPLPDITNDRVAIEQIFSNIIENAVKYLQPGRRGVIQVRGRIEGRRAIFEVEDNGRGVDPKDHQRIFELFRRSGAQDQRGEGIGLAQVWALITRLGGHIDIESSLGVGSIFRLNLPVAYEDHGVDQ